MDTRTKCLARETRTPFTHTHRKPNKSLNFVLPTTLDRELVSITIDKGNLFNRFFISVFSKVLYEMEAVKVNKHFQLTNFSVSGTRNEENIRDLDVSKSKSQDAN